MDQPTFNNNIQTLITRATGDKKKDKPVLKPIEKKKRGRKPNPIILISRETGEFVLSFH